MSELEWYQLQAELVSLKKRKANAEKELERSEEIQRDILWIINNKRVTLRIRINDFEEWIDEKEEEILEKMMMSRQREVAKVSGQGL